GAELIRLVARHPGLALAFVSSRELDGQPVAAHVPDAAVGALCFEALGPADVAARGADVVVLALPNGAAAAFVDALEQAAPGAVMVDVSADHRFDEGWYYGLPELTRARHHGQRRIS